MKKFTVKDGERLDDLQRDGYSVIQKKDGFCFGIDAVLLSDFAKGKNFDKILDIGTGTGIIPILMAIKYKNTSYVGVEIQEDIGNMAIRSVIGNNLENRINIINDNILNIETYFEHGYFNVVTSNPPYMLLGNGETNISKTIAISRHEIECNFDDIINFGNKMLKYGGYFYLVHRPNRLIDIISVMRKYKIEPKRIRFVQPFLSTKPNIVLIEGLKGGKSGLDIMENLIVYKEKGIYTDEVFKIHYE